MIAEVLAKVSELAISGLPKVKINGLAVTGSELTKKVSGLSKN